MLLSSSHASSFLCLAYNTTYNKHSCRRLSFSLHYHLTLQSTSKVTAAAEGKIGAATSVFFHICLSPPDPTLKISIYNAGGPIFIWAFIFTTCYVLYLCPTPKCCEQGSPPKLFLWPIMVLLHISQNRSRSGMR